LANSSATGWRLVYHDETAALFVPLDDRHREIDGVKRLASTRTW
jgi:hypothetical protein